MNIDQVKIWDLEEIKSFVKGTSALEGWYHDFKGISLGSTGKIRKVFCSFANSEGGFILHGVSNGIKIVGTNRDTEMKAKVNRMIKNGITPPIPSKNWDVKEFKLSKSGNKYIYLLYVHPSLYFERPHVTDQKVYVRGNGSCDPIEDGGDLRRRFLIDKFFPDHIRQIEEELEKIKECRLKPDAIDFMYFMQMRNYLESRLSDGRGFNDLLEKLRKIIALYEEIRNAMNTGAISGEPVSVADSEQINTQYSNLESLIEEFIDKFKSIHKI